MSPPMIVNSLNVSVNPILSIIYSIRHAYSHTIHTPYYTHRIIHRKTLHTTHILYYYCKPHLINTGTAQWTAAATIWTRRVGEKW